MFPSQPAASYGMRRLASFASVRSAGGLREPDPCSAVVRCIVGDWGLAALVVLSSLRFPPKGMWLLD